MRFSLSLVFLGLLASACSTGGVRVAHPASTGTLVATTATSLPSVERTIGEGEGNPTLLEDSATLVRLDGQEVCFVIVARYVRWGGVEIDDGLARASLTHDEGTISPPRAAVAPPSILGRSVQDAYETDDFGNTYATGGTETYEYVQREGVLCFPHAGAIAPSNERLRLTWDANRFDFALEAAAPPSAWPAGAITAPGYESVASR